MSEKVKEFESLARPLIKWLCDNNNPYTTIIITPTDAKLLEGLMSTGQIFDYVKE